jgi:hypothetical protein
MSTDYDATLLVVSGAKVGVKPNPGHLLLGTLTDGGATDRISLRGIVTRLAGPPRQLVATATVATGPVVATEMPAVAVRTWVWLNPITVRHPGLDRTRGQFVNMPHLARDLAVHRVTTTLSPAF